MLPGTKGVPESTPTYVVFDQREGIVRFLKRDEFQVVRGPRKKQEEVRDHA